MVSWNIISLRFGGDSTPQASSDKVIGSQGNNEISRTSINQKEYQKVVEIRKDNDNLTNIYDKIVDVPQKDLLRFLSFCVGFFM